MPGRLARNALYLLLALLGWQALASVELRQRVRRAFEILAALLVGSSLLSLWLHYSGRL